MILTGSFSNVTQEPGSSPASQTWSFHNVSLFQVKAAQSTQSFRLETWISSVPPPSPHPTVHYAPGPPDSASLMSPNSSFLCARLSPPQGFPQQLHLGLASGLHLFATGMACTASFPSSLATTAQFSLEKDPNPLLAHVHQPAVGMWLGPDHSEHHVPQQ